MTNEACTSQACGFDPLDSFRTVQVFVLRAAEAEGQDEGEALDEVAFIARGELDHEALARCVGEVVSGDGGGVHRTTIEGADALASDHGTSVAAFLGRDGVVAGADVVGSHPARAHSDTTATTRRERTGGGYARTLDAVNVRAGGAERC